MSVEQYDCGGVFVHAEEMHHRPRQTFDTVLCRWGPAAAESLYRQWWKTVPDTDARHSDLWDAGREMREILGLPHSPV